MATKMTREEAINIVRNIYQTDKEKEALATLIPELAESEDERIRKAIIHYILYETKGAISEDTEHTWVKWLEKQKEQKKEKFPPYVTGFKGHPDPAGTSDLEEAAKEYASKTLCDPDDGPSTGLAKESFIAGAKWQKEQKSVDNPKWNELTWKDINELERIINNVHYEFQNGIGEDSFGELVLERFREYKDDGSMDEQKPAEWDKEDKEMFEAVDESLYCYESGKAPEAVAQIEAERCWLSSLPERFNLQPKQEWSEEDEKDMAHIIRILDDCYVYGTHDLSKTDRENLVNKLKSLRPSWKPSEEQMEALYDACCIAFEEERCFHPSLSRLYHDLRKL